MDFSIFAVTLLEYRTKTLSDAVQANNTLMELVDHEGK